MSLKVRLKEAVKSAMKAKNQLRVETLRLVLSELQYEEMQKNTEALPEEEVLTVLKRELKKRKEELEFAEKAGREELSERLRLEAATIEEFMPKQMSADELEEIIAGMRKRDPGLNLGAIMKLLKESYSGQYDAKLASDIVRSMF